MKKYDLDYLFQNYIIKKLNIHIYIPIEIICIIIKYVNYREKYKLITLNKKLLKLHSNKLKLYYNLTKDIHYLAYNYLIEEGSLIFKEDIHIFYKTYEDNIDNHKIRNYIIDVFVTNIYNERCNYKVLAPELRVLIYLTRTHRKN